MWALVPLTDAGELTSRGWNRRVVTLQLIQDGKQPTPAAINEQARHVTPRARQLAEREAAAEHDPGVSAAAAAKAPAAEPRQPGAPHCAALCTCTESCAPGHNQYFTLVQHRLACMLAAAMPSRSCRDLKGELPFCRAPVPGVPQAPAVGRILPAR